MYKAEKRFRLAQERKIAERRHRTEVAHRAFMRVPSPANLRALTIDQAQRARAAEIAAKLAVAGQ